MKQAVERKIGQIYPPQNSMPKVKPTHSGNSAYAKRIKQIHDQWLAEGKQSSWQDFMRQRKSTSTEPTPGPSRDISSTTPGDIFEVLDSPLSMHSPMYQEEIPQQETGRGAAGSATAINSSSVIQQKHLQISRGYMSFGKSRIFYTYGYAYLNLIVKHTNDNKDMGDIRSSSRFTIH